MIKGESEKNHMLSWQKKVVTLQNVWLERTGDGVNFLPTDSGGLPGGTNTQERASSLLFPLIPI